ncbi:MAG: hypothetical protein ACFBQW_02225 [Sphingomonadaceae bacterium]
MKACVLPCALLLALCACGDGGETSEKTAAQAEKLTGAQPEEIAKGPPAPPPTPPEKRRRIEAIPPEYHGPWASDEKACANANAETRMRIWPERIEYHESAALVMDAMADGANAITLKLAFTGEGETWTETQHLALSSNDEKLAISSGEASIARIRCGGEPPP